MPTSNENFFTNERLRAIGMGIGRGFQSYDPNNPFASAGAAIEGSLGYLIAADERKKTREERLQDLAAIEEKQKQAEQRSVETQIQSEQRSEERQIRAEERQRANAKKDQQEMLDRFKQMKVGVVSKGTASAERTASEFAKWFANTMGGGHPRFKGNSPISLYDERTMSDPKPQRSRGMMRTNDGRMVKAIEDSDQTTPIFGEGGRDYAN